MATLVPELSTYPVVTPVAPSFDSLFKLWMLPTQMGLSMMENSLNLMIGAMPMARDAAEKTGAQAQEIARAAEEQVAHIDDGEGVIPTPAGLVA